MDQIIHAVWIFLVQTAQKCAVFFVQIAHNKIMKKTLFFLLSMSILANGLAMPASAQHCDVQRGDSMWRIAKRYNVHFHDVLNMNKHFKNPHLIHPKDEVELPDGSTGTSTDQSGTGESDAQKSESTTAEMTQAEAVLKLVNQERSKAGLQPLTLTQKLTDIANTKAKDMADKGYFSHESPTYGSPFDMLKKFGVSFSYAGENIAAGQKTAEEVMNSWMNSSGHKANILNKNYTQIGVGFYRGGQYGTEWVQLFIKP